MGFNNDTPSIINLGVPKTDFDAHKVETAKYKLSWINAVEYGLDNKATSGTSVTNSQKLQEIINMIGANGGVIYFPSGKYYFNGGVLIKNSNITFTGDGVATIFEDYTIGSLFKIIGKSIYEGDVHLKHVHFRDLKITRQQPYSLESKSAIVCECVTAFLMENCWIAGSGSFMDFNETFDSRIANCEFDLSGRLWKANVEIPNDTIDDYTPTINFNSQIVSYDQEGYETVGYTLETTNQILFTKCRFESFSGGALNFVGGSNGIKLNQCKFESKRATVPFIIIKNGSVSGLTLSDCYMCTFATSSNAGLIYISSGVYNSSFDINVSVEEADGLRVFNGDAITILTSVDSSFGGNLFNLFFTPSYTDGVAKINSSNYLISCNPNKELLYTQGNDVILHLNSNYGGSAFTGSLLQIINSVPTHGFNRKGDVIKFTEPDLDGYTNAICTVTGTPGTWKRFGLIEV